MLIESTNGERPSKAKIQLLLEKYIQYLADEIPKSPYRALGEPRRVVRELRRAGAVVGIGTGNLRSGARLKLQSAGLADLFDGQKGGYGEDGKTRADILSYGARACDPTGKLPVVIVGDTPRDVLAAHEIGGRCIGVPFGANDAKTLKNAGAEATAEAVDLTIVPLIRKLCRN
jgi:phosphoglycolate phosphatase-like HAD superfamily hydrolase